LKGFFDELSRRNVLRVGGTYLALAWFLVSVTDVAVLFLNLPEVLTSVVIYLALIGLPLALFFAWAYELTPDGLKRAEDVTEDDYPGGHKSRKLEHILLAILVVAMSVVLWDAYIAEPSDPTQALHEGESAPVRQQPVAAPKSIAVLPFVNLSSDPEQEYFSDGLTEEILNLLARNRELKVIGRTSSFAFKGKSLDLRELGKALGVRTVLEGSVRKSGNRIRITVRLIEVADGTNLWAETYDREITDIFEIQDDVAAAIIDALQAQMGGNLHATRGRPTANMEAYALFLRATAWSGSDASPAAVPLLLAATVIDPQYAEAFELLAYSYYNQDASLLDSALNQQLVLETSAKALSLDPSLTLARALYVMADFSATRLERYRYMQEAIGQQPNNPYLINMQIWNLLETGYLERALLLTRRLKEIEPWAARSFFRLFQTQSALGLEEEAINAGEAAIEMRHLYAPTSLARFLLLLERDEEAIPLLQEVGLVKAASDEEAVRSFLSAARDPVNGPDFIIGSSNELAARLPPEEAQFIRNDIEYWCLAFGHLDCVFDRIEEKDSSASRWSRVDELLATMSILPRSRAVFDPRYLDVATAEGLVALWEVLGPPHHCRKLEGLWECG